MSLLLMEKLLRHQQLVRSGEGRCVDRLNSPPDNGHEGGWAFACYEAFLISRLLGSFLTIEFA